MMVRNLLALGGAIALALVSAVTLQAQGYFDDFYDDEPPVREAVSTRGLDLTSPEGIGELEARINRAIDRVCPDEHGRNLHRVQSVRECREDAVANVRPQVDRAVAAAEERQYLAYRAPGRWRREGPPPVRYAMRAPAPDHAWHGEDERGWREDRPDYQWRLRERAPKPPMAAPAPLAKAKPASPPPGGRVVKRTVTTTTVTTTTSPGGAPSAPVVVEKTVIEKHAAAPARAAKWKPKQQWRTARAAAYARRPAVAGSWLPPVAWAASDRAAVSAFRTGKLARWRLTDRDGIARSGYVTVSQPRWVGGCACRNVQTVKYHGRRQIVVAAGMRCLAGKRLVNRAA